jgi:MFS family permease
MKRASVIIAVVAGYCLIESVALIYPLNPSFSNAYPSSTYVEVLLLAHLLLIPVVGILLNRFFSGPHRWKRRAVVGLLMGAVFLPGALILLVLVSGLLGWIYEAVNALLCWALLLVALIGGIAGSFLAIRKVRRWNVQLNAASWLAEHQSGMLPRERKLRNRAILVASWIPVVTVFFVSLFLFEIWGVLFACSRISLRWTV